MKRKLFGGLLVVAIAAIAAFNVNMNTEKNELSALALANVEALAQSENYWGVGTGSCGVYVSMDGYYSTICNIPKERALEVFNNSPASTKYWCCSTCSSTSYCGR